MSAIELRDVRKSYESGATVLHGISLAARDGEFVVVVGPSGCGKSTLLRIVAGLEACDSGEVAIGGRLANDTPPRDRDIAMIFQNYALYPHMSVRENIAFGLELRGMPKQARNARAEAVARTLKLEPWLDRKPGALSGGQRQRVAMGRAMARDATTFLMDEPLSNLDNALRTEMRAEIKELHRQLGATILYVTHDQTEALSLADRIAVLKDGRLLQFDTPAAIYDRPANRFVAAFLGQPAMNLVPAEALPGLSGGRGEVAGVRPDTLGVETSEPDGPSLPARLVMQEMTGSGVILHCDTPAGRIVVAASRHQAAMTSESFWLRVDPLSVHRFDGETGDRIAAA